MRVSREVMHLNPGIFGAVATIVTQRREYNQYKQNYLSSFSKMEHKIIWKIHIDDLKKRALEFQTKYRMLMDKQRWLYSDDYFAVDLFRIMQEYNCNNSEIQHLICYDDREFSAYEKQLYKKLKEKYEERA